MDLISYNESLRLLQGQIVRMRGTPEMVPVRQCLGRVLAAPAAALRSNPAEPLAAMDGVVLDAGIVNDLPVVLQHGQWERINTGEVVPPQFNAVVRIEDVRWDGELPELQKPVAYFQNVRPVAEDFDSNDLLFPAGHLIGAADLSLLLSAGITDLKVFRRPIVTFLPTGSEFVTDPGRSTTGKIPESNSAMIGALVEEWGGIFRIHDPIKDDPELLVSALKGVLSATDILVLSAGTSRGTRDFTHDVLQTLGTVLFHGVAIHPARPVLLAQIGDVPVLGLPGYPSAAYLAALLYLKPLVCALSEFQPPTKHEVYICAEEIGARKEDSFYRVQCFDVDGRIYVRRIQRGSSSVRALSEMDGVMHVPPNTAIHKRDAVRVNVVQARTSPVIAVRGARHSYAMYLFGLFRMAMPMHRLLFWEAEPEEALEGIIERNTHIAVLRTQSGRDLFPPFAIRLQEYMRRYRLFTRTLSLLLRPGLSSLPRDSAVAVPESLIELWRENVPSLNLQLQPVFINAGEQQVAGLLEHGWNAVFADIRFLKAGCKAIGRIQESCDLVVSEGHFESDPSIKKLIDLALSPEYEAWLGRHGVFDPASRGLI